MMPPPAPVIVIQPFADMTAPSSRAMSYNGFSASCGPIRRPSPWSVTPRSEQRRRIEQFIKRAQGDRQVNGVRTEPPRSTTFSNSSRRAAASRVTGEYPPQFRQELSDEVADAHRV